MALQLKVVQFASRLTSGKEHFSIFHFGKKINVNPMLKFYINCKNNLSKMLFLLGFLVLRVEERDPSPTRPTQIKSSIILYILNAWKWSKPCKPSLLAPFWPLPGCTPMTCKNGLETENALKYKVAMGWSILAAVSGVFKCLHLNEPRNLGSKATLGTASAWGYQFAYILFQENKSI